MGVLIESLSKGGVYEQGDCSRYHWKIIHCEEA